jgi:hypothetical protein
MSEIGTYGASKKGNKTFILNGHEYCKHRDKENGHVIWRCVKVRVLKCKAVVITDGLRVVNDDKSDHNHEGNIARVLSRKAVGDMKSRMSDSVGGSSAVQGAVQVDLPPHTLMALPKKASLSRVLRRQRQKVLATDHNETALPRLPTDMSFAIPPRFANMVLYDSGPGNGRIIMLGQLDVIEGLSRSTLWLADGTFKVTPGLIFQLYSIHFQFVPGITPAAIYCLLPNKLRATYDRVMTELKRIIPRARPTTVLTDFETAAMSAFAAAFPIATVSGCYFHLSQSVMRKVNDLGMKETYETDDEARGSIRCLAALAFVPVDHVMRCFEILEQAMPAIERMDELLSYFEHTYVRGRPRRDGGYGPPLFAIATWNKRDAATDGLARTTNAVEGWHYGLQALFQSSHPTMWTFLTGLKADIVKQQALFLQGVAGEHQPPKKKYRDLNDRVKRAVATYGLTDGLTFLRAMAFLSHS